MTAPLCRHCGTRKQARPRGLCWTCFGDLDIREQYTSDSIYASYAAREGTGELVEPDAGIRTGNQHKCLWGCGEAVQGPLRLCQTCQGWLLRAEEGMPPDERPVANYCPDCRKPIDRRARHCKPCSQAGSRNSYCKRKVS